MPGLFHRTSRSVALTPADAALLRPPVSAWPQLERARVAGAATAGPVAGCHRRWLGSSSGEPGAVSQVPSATFAEVIGQDHVTHPLMHALASGRINHAYLFSGPRGCGKTSSARASSPGP